MSIVKSLRARFVTVGVALLTGCSSLTGAPSGTGVADAARASARLDVVRTANGVPFVGRPDALVARAIEAKPRSERSAVAEPSTKSPKWAASLFVSDFTANAVDQFQPKKNGKVLHAIADVVNPQGLDSDAAGNLWVASTGNSTVREYTPGKYAAMTVLSDPDEFPVSVAVCANGTVYVSNAYNVSNLPGNIEIYAPGSTSPTGIVPDTNAYSPRFVACDASNVLWFDYLDYNYYAAVASYDGTTVTEYGSLGIGFPGGIRVGNNGTTLGIADQYVGVELFTKSNPAGGPYLTLKGFTDPVSFSFDKAQKNVFVADGSALDVVKKSLKGATAFSLGTGTLQQPIDAYDFPAGDT